MTKFCLLVAISVLVFVSFCKTNPAQKRTLRKAQNAAEPPAGRQLRPNGYHTLKSPQQPNIPVQGGNGQQRLRRKPIPPPTPADRRKNQQVLESTEESTSSQCSDESERKRKRRNHRRPPKATEQVIEVPQEGRWMKGRQASPWKPSPVQQQLPPQAPPHQSPQPYNHLGYYDHWQYGMNDWRNNDHWMPNYGQPRLPMPVRPVYQPYYQNAHWNPPYFTTPAPAPANPPAREPYNNNVNTINNQPQPFQSISRKEVAPNAVHRRRGRSKPAKPPPVAAPAVMMMMPGGYVPHSPPHVKKSAKKRQKKMKQMRKKRPKQKRKPGQAPRSVGDSASSSDSFAQSSFDGSESEYFLPQR